MTDISTIILTLFGLFFGGISVLISLFLWLRSEANSDRKHITEVQSGDRKDLLNLMRTIQNEAKEFRSVMAQESKDFHGRLCAIEERRK